MALFQHRDTEEAVKEVLNRQGVCSRVKHSFFLVTLRLSGEQRFA
jgi:hypothetical protein